MQTGDEIYVSTDIETDGPSPGHYSMLSLGSAAFRLDRTVLGTFERNLELLPGARQHPAHMDWWATQPDAWAACRRDLQPPARAMAEYLEWARSLPGQPIFVAHPVEFDYTFVAWYLHEFTGEDPFAGALDLPSYAMAVLRQPLTRSRKPYMPREWFDPSLPHTHRALDDALGHAMLFCSMVEASRR
jgi:DNA polymerase III alpha subunit (gram-positive type)